MIDEHIITESELDAFQPGRSLAGELQALILQQRSTWDLARIGYEGREKAATRQLIVDDVNITLQFNPGRIKSTTARVDEKSTARRPCFLCETNIPPEQRGILYGNEYLILVNPYPIFPEHFTVPRIMHTPQAILPEIEILLDLARDLSPDFLALYNGPRSGASAPDHLHFQIGTRSYLPLLKEYDGVRERWGRLLAGREDLRAYSVDHYLPPFISLESSSLQSLINAFHSLYGILQKFSMTDDEPMMNLLCWFDEEEWRLVAFLRAKHRPARFYARRDRRMLISPGAIDLGGVVVVPVQKDFEKIQAPDIEAIMEEVSLPSETFREITCALGENLGADQEK